VSNKVSEVINKNIVKIGKIFADEFNEESVKLIEEGYLHYSADIFKNPEERKNEAIPFNRFNCVYFLMAGDCVLYVGQTSHLCARVATHVNTGKKFEPVSYYEVEREDMLLIEAFNISYYNPALNIDIPGMKELIYLVSRKVS